MYVDIGFIECGEYVVEVYCVWYVDVQCVWVWCGQCCVFDYWQLCWQVIVDVQQEVFYVQFGQQGVYWFLFDDLVMVDDCQVVVQVFGFFQVVGGEDDCGVGIVDFFQYVLYVVVDFDVYVGGGFVQDQQSWVGYYCVGDYQLVFYVVGQCVVYYLCFFLQVCVFQFFFGVFFGFFVWYVVEVGVVYQDVEGFFEQVEVDFLWYQFDQVYGGVVVVYQVVVEYFYLVFVEVDQGVDDVDQG